jgi:hypothetical protein
LIYTLLYDTSLVQVDAAAKRAEIERRRKVFTGALLNMKACEGGTLSGEQRRPAPQKPRR